MPQRHAAGLALGQRIAAEHQREQILQAEMPQQRRHQR